MGQTSDRRNWHISLHFDQSYWDEQRGATEAFQESFAAEKCQPRWDKDTEELFEVLQEGTLQLAAEKLNTFLFQFEIIFFNAVFNFLLKNVLLLLFALLIE